MDKELKNAATLVGNARIEILELVKNFLENKQPIIFTSCPFSKEIFYTIKSKKYGEILLKFFKHDGVDNYTYSVRCLDLELDLVPTEKNKAKCDVLLHCKYKATGLEEYERWRKIKIN